MASGEIAGRLQAATVAAMKAKDRDRLTVLRMLQAAVKQVEVDTREEVDDDAVVAILRSYAKKVRDALDGARKGGRDDLAARNEAELVIVAEFLPAELDDAVLAGLVDEAVAETGAEGPRDMGKVMKAVMVKVAGRADGSRVSAAVKQRLLP